MQRLIGLIASALIPLVPFTAGAAEHHARGERPIARERMAPRALPYREVGEERARRPIERRIERPIAREEAPRPPYSWYAPRAERRRFVEPRTDAPRRIERRNSFMRYYSERYTTRTPERERIVFHRYAPRRIFVAPPLPVVRTYYARPAYVRTVSLPVYYNAPVQLPLPIAWTPPTYEYNSYPYYGQYNGYSQYPQYSYASAPYPYANQYPGGYNAPFGMNPFGNAQLQGVVISSTNGGVLVLTPDLKPVFVNLSIAQQNGYVNGNISPGSFVNIFGYNTGNEFIATALS